MSKRRKVNIGITDNGDDTCDILIGLFGETVPNSELLDQSNDLECVRHSLVAAWQIGPTFGTPEAAEFIVAVNGPGLNGIEGPDGRYKIISILAADVPDIWTVNFRVEKTQAKYGITITSAELEDPEPLTPHERVRRNLRAFLRINGDLSINPAALARIRLAKFVV